MDMNPPLKTGLPENNLGIDLAALAKESRVPQALAGTIIPTAIGAVFFFARFYTRICMTRNWGWDDTITAVAFVLSLALAVLDCSFVNYGVGRHQIFQTLPDVIMTLKLAYISRIIYQFVLMLTKIAICLFYLRIFRDKSSRWVAYSIMAFLVLTFIPLEVLVVFQCTPLENNYSLTQANCLPIAPISISTTVSNVLADLALMAFVMPRIFKLQMARNQKLTLLAVVSLGFLVIIASIVRAVLVSQVVGQADLAFKGYEIQIWSTVEISTGFFCSCAPCIRPLLQELFPGAMRSIDKSLSSSTSRADGRSYGGPSMASRARGRGDAFELTSHSEDDIDFAKLKESGAIHAQTEWSVTVQSKKEEDVRDFNRKEFDVDGDEYDEYESEGGRSERRHIERVGGRSVVASGPRSVRLSTDSEIARFEHV